MPEIVLVRQQQLAIPDEKRLIAREVFTLISQRRRAINQTRIAA